LWPRNFEGPEEFVGLIERRGHCNVRREF
jgi:hypothetical protein